MLALVAITGCASRPYEAFRQVIDHASEQHLRELDEMGDEATQMLIGILESDALWFLVKDISGDLHLSVQALQVGPRTEEINGFTRTKLPAPVSVNVTIKNLQVVQWAIKRSEQRRH